VGSCTCLRRAAATGPPTLPGWLNEECKSTFGFSYKQLQKVRKAARTGALRHRAGEFGVELPDGYVDQPQAASNVPQPVG